MASITRTGSLVRLLLAIAVGVGVALLVRNWLRNSSPVPPLSVVTSASPLAQITIKGRVVGEGATRIALPPDTSFQLRVNPPAAGRVEVHNINPLGVRRAEPLWSQEAAGAGTLESPALRMAAPAGLDTLVVSFQPRAGGQRIQQELQVWHP